MKRKIACLLTLFILGINFPALGNDKEIKVTEDLLKSEGFAVAKPSGIGFEKRFADRESCVKFFKKFVT